MIGSRSINICLLFEEILYNQAVADSSTGNITQHVKMEITFVHDVLLLCLLSWYEETVPSVRIYSIGQKLRHCRF